MNVLLDDDPRLVLALAVLLAFALVVLVLAASGLADGVVADDFELLPIEMPLPRRASADWIPANKTNKATEVIPSDWIFLETRNDIRHLNAITAARLHLICYNFGQKGLENLRFAVHAGFTINGMPAANRRRSRSCFPPSALSVVPHLETA
jgi:hypothetical protein